MTARKGRTRRKPLGTRAKLEIPEKYIEAGYVYRVVNDTPGRLEDFQEAGWEFVKRSDSEVDDGSGSNLSFHVGVGADKKPLRAFAMRIKKEWFDEDQAAKQEELDAKQAVILGGVEGVPHAYTPGQASATVTENPVTVEHRPRG